MTITTIKVDENSPIPIDNIIRVDAERLTDEQYQKITELLNDEYRKLREFPCPEHKTIMSEVGPDVFYCAECDAYWDLVKK